MPLNRDVIGREYPASDVFEVSREQVLRFADAIGDPDPLHRDREAARAAGHRDVLAPPTFLTLLAFRFGAEGPVADPSLGLDYSRVVHGEQSFAFSRPVVAGDVLCTVQLVEDVRDAGRNELMTVLTRVTDDAGEPVAEIRTTLVSRGTAAGKQARA